MSIIRRPKKKNYSILSNVALRDDTLSWGAKGLYAYLMTLPDDWLIRKTELTRHASDGKASCSSKFQELVDAGYIQDIEKMEKGLTRHEYIVHEVATSSDYRMPLSGCRSADAVNRTLLSTKEKSTKEENPHSPPKGDAPKKEVPISPAPKPEPLKFVQDNPPTLEEVVENALKTGKRNMNPYKFYAKYSDPDVNWVGGNGKKMKSWKLVMSTWNSNAYDGDSWQKHPSELAKGAFAPQPPAYADFVSAEDDAIVRHLDECEERDQKSETPYPESFWKWKRAMLEFKKLHQGVD